MEKGFELNPYDIYVANKLVNGKQCTLVGYVDDKKVSHTEAELAEDSNQRFEKHFGDLLVTGGKKHTFWGVNINIMEDKKVEIWIKEKLLEEIEAFG